MENLENVLENNAVDTGSTELMNTNSDFLDSNDEWVELVPKSSNSAGMSPVVAGLIGAGVTALIGAGVKFAVRKIRERKLEKMVKEQETAESSKE